MSTELFKVGDIVKASYKSGEYIGEIVQYSEPKAVVKILAVLKHPEQGDLHHPMEVDVPMFHQRRALAFQERALIPLSSIQLYPYQVPGYNTSLKEALETEMALLHKTELWARRCQEELASLQQEYF
ncbi:MAG TPA: sporulation phosphorelay system protein KapB [Bacilli bacterium]